MYGIFQKSFSARAVSRSHQRAEHILKNMQQEDEKRRLGREASIITAIPIAQEACYEPTCSPPSEQEEEGQCKNAVPNPGLKTKYCLNQLHYNNLMHIKSFTYSCFAVSFYCQFPK